MKADIQSQIELINEQMTFPEFFDFVTEDVDKIRKRKAFLEHTLNAPCSEIDEKAVKFVYKD